MVILSILIPLSLFSWIKIAPLPAPVETIYPIIADPNNNCCISYIENVYVNVNAVAKQQVDPNKHMLKVTNHTGWSGGIYWDSHPTTYSLVNKNLEKGN